MGFKKQQKEAHTKWKRSAPKGVSNEQLEEYDQQLLREEFWLSTEFPNSGPSNRVHSSVLRC